MPTRKIGLASLLWIFASCQAVPQTTPPTSGPRTIAVVNAGDLQAAFNAAQPGDTIELTTGLTYTGNFRIPPKAGNSDAYITVRSTGYSELPEGQRVTPESASKMAKILTPNPDPAIQFLATARNWRFIGIEVTNAEGVYAYELIRNGELEETNVARQPVNIEFDRMYIHNGNSEGTKRGIFVNSNAFKLTNSYLSNFKSKFQDAMAMAVCNGPGPHEISNNYLEGAGYSIIFGGCGNGIVKVAPSDVVFTRNHVFKPLSWQKEGWVVKNQFEIKVGRRFRIEGNVFENNWVGGQSGFGVLFTTRAEGKDETGAPWTVIEDILFTNNVIINSPNGINVLGQDEATQNRGQASRITIRNNLFLAVTGRLFQFLQNPKDILIEKNTDIYSGNLVMSENKTSGFVMRDNIFSLAGYGIFGSGLGSGNKVLEENFPGATVRNNGFIGEGVSGYYPSGNTYLNKLADVRFVDAEARNFRLQPSSPLRGKGLNGRDPGVNMDELEAAINGVAPIRNKPVPKVTAAVHSMDYTPVVSPGVVLSVFGESMANCVLAQPTAPLPRKLCETVVRIDGEAAPLLYVSPSQVLAQVPSTAIAGRRLEVQVVTDGGESEIFSIDPENVKPASPAMSYYRVTGAVTGEWAVLTHADGKYNGPLGEGNPLRPGAKASLRLGGLGKTTPPTPDGDVPRSEPPPIPESPVEIYINDTFQPLESAKALGNAIGLFDLVFTLAENTPIGGLAENWIWVNVQGVESIRRRLQLAAAEAATN